MGPVRAHPVVTPLGASLESALPRLPYDARLVGYSDSAKGRIALGDVTTGVGLGTVIVSVAVAYLFYKSLVRAS